MCQAKHKEPKRALQHNENIHFSSGAHKMTRRNRFMPRLLRKTSLFLLVHFCWTQNRSSFHNTTQTQKNLIAPKINEQNDEGPVSSPRYRPFGGVQHHAVDCCEMRRSMA
mmetsp:Transcript_27796/g.77881  ORF Transcript_27796/g.77881 Transcript_27796/m.77881 type:complete len:110 (+) Transcript_27796:29-358(+)